MDYVSQEYWDKSYENLDIESLFDEDPIVKLINKVVEWNEVGQGEVMELGSYPGRYLRVFGDKGYCVSGVDTTAKVTAELTDVFRAKGYCIGDIICGDVFKYNPAKNFDVVCSFGFIEHFTNWEEVIMLHLKFVKKGGIVLITVPNFKGFFQKYFHYIFDKENLDRHNLQAMVVEQWHQVLKKNDVQYETLFDGAFGDIEFWVDEEKRSRLKSFLMHKVLRVLNSLTRLKLSPSKSYSPYLGLVIKLK